MPSAANTVERVGELPGPISDQVPKIGYPVAEMPGELPGGLHRPLPRRMRGHAEDVHDPIPHVHGEEHVHPREGHQVDVEGVAREKTLGVGAGERAPAVLARPVRRRRQPVRT